MQNTRVYHSVAVLLPDGRVLVGGGGRPPSDDNIVQNPNFEIFSPPYLFSGPRPDITSAPTVISYGTQFSIMTPDASNIVAVNLIRLGSVTHAFDQNQRIAKLNFVVSSGELDILAPIMATIAPPGHYMLFIIDQAGVPSIANIVQLN